MSVRTIVVRHHSPVVIVTKAHLSAELIAWVDLSEQRIRFDSHLDRVYPPFVRAVTEWRCTDREGGPELHEPNLGWSPDRRPKYLHILEVGDEIRLTTMRELFRRHVLVTQRDGRMVVTGESGFYSLFDHDRAYE